MSGDQLTVSIDCSIVHKVVYLHFPKPITWISMGPDSARELGRAIIKKADELEGRGK